MDRTYILHRIYTSENSAIHRNAEHLLYQTVSSFNTGEMSYREIRQRSVAQEGGFLYL